MIVLQGLSQVVYQIDDTRYTCYTNEENRTIAEFIVSWDYCEDMLELCNSENNELRTQKQTYETYYIASKKYNNELSRDLDNCLLIGKEYQELYVETKAKFNRGTNLLYTSIVVNVILTTIILIK